jgi:hypothetical protein
MGSYFDIRSFVADSASGDPVKDAVKNGTRQANDYLEKQLEDTETTTKVISTSTHIIGHGNYFSYIITMTLEVHYPEPEDEETKDEQS